MSNYCLVCGADLLPDGRCSANPPPRLVRIPRRFYDDHQARDLSTPEIVRESARHYWIDLDDSAASELLSDARYYASEAMYMDPPRPGLAASARATVRAIEDAPYWIRETRMNAYTRYARTARRGWLAVASNIDVIQAKNPPEPQHDEIAVVAVPNELAASAPEMARLLSDVSTRFEPRDRDDEDLLDDINRIRSLAGRLGVLS